MDLKLKVCLWFFVMVADADTSFVRLHLEILRVYLEVPILVNGISMFRYNRDQLVARGGGVLPIVC